MKEAEMIQVKWDETVCIHSANCVKKLPNVFKVENGQFMIDESGAWKTRSGPSWRNVPPVH